MQRVQKATLPLDAQRTRTSRTAWAVLLIALLAFCALGSALSYGGWRYRNEASTAPRPGAHLIVRSPDFADSITWTERGNTKPRVAANGQELNEGDALAIPRSQGSPYGQMASLRLFDESQLDLWAGADMSFEKLQTSRWSNRIELVELVQRSGYVRYDLRDNQPFSQVIYRVRVGGEGGPEVLLAPGGSYSIDIRPPDRRVVRLGNFATPPMLGDIAVRRGEAQVRGGGGASVVRAGQKVALDAGGLPTAPVPARWELIGDNRFGNYTQEQYNNTTIPGNPSRSDSWQVTSKPAIAGDRSGFFKINPYCLPLGSTGDCTALERINAANFYRTGDQTTSFITGVRQTIDRDVSEYRSLRLALKLRVLNQSLSVGGDAGAECPVIVKLIYKNTSPADGTNELVSCFYYRNDAGQEVQAPEIQYHQVRQFEWFAYSDELREGELVDARYIQEIQIYAAGHDYNAEITDVTLVGSQ